MKRCTVGLAILALLTTGVAQAQLGGPASPRLGHWEFTLNTTYTPEQDYEGDYGSKVSLDDDLGWGFGFGYNFSDQFGLGLIFNWRSFAYNATIVGGEGHEGETAYYSNWLDTGTIALSGEYSFLRSRVTPYVNGRVGWTSVDTNIIADSDYGCWYDPWWGYTCYSYDTTYGADAASWSIGAGLRFELTPVMFLRAGYDYGWVDLDSYDGADLIRVDLGLLY